MVLIKRNGDISNMLDEIFSTFDRVKMKKVLVIGDIILDKYLFGRTNHTSTGIQIPIIEKERIEYRLGGAGNVAANISKLCEDTILCGCYANDSAGIKVRELCQKYNIKLNQLAFIDETIQKTRIYISS